MEKSRLVLEINKDEKETFIRICKDLESDASKELRKYIKKFIVKNGQGKLGI